MTLYKYLAKKDASVLQWYKCVGIPFSLRRSRGLMKDEAGFGDVNQDNETLNPILPRLWGYNCIWRHDGLEHNFRLCTFTSWSHMNSGTRCRMLSLWSHHKFLQPLRPNLNFANMNKIFSHFVKFNMRQIFGSFVLSLIQPHNKIFSGTDDNRPSKDSTN